MDKWTLMLSVKLDYTNLPGYKPIRYLIYRGGKIDLSQKQFDILLEKLPTKYYNEKEKLTKFIVQKNDDGILKYFSEYELEVFDFGTREYIKKKRDVVLSEEEYGELYLIFKEVYNLFYIKSAENFYDTLLTAVRDVKLTAAKMTELRNELLEESDKYMLPDFPISQEEKDAWINYRQELRDITNQEAWPNDIENIDFPVSPDPITQGLKLWSEINLNEIIGNQIEIDSLKNQLGYTIKKFASLSIKAGIVSSLSTLKIPLFVEQDMLPKEIVQLEDELTTLTTLAQFDSISAESIGDIQSDYSQALDMINEKIDFINKKLSEHNVNFTIEDLINDIMQDTILYNEANEILESLGE